MTTVAVGGTLPNIIEMAKTHGQFGQTLPIVNTLQKAAPLVGRYMYWQQSNLPNGQLTVRVTGRPTASVRRVNQAIAPSKATFDQVTEAMCEISALAKVDPALLNGFQSAMMERARLLKYHPEVIAEDLEDTVINGSSADGSGEFDGFLVRPELSALGDQCLSASGTPSGSSNSSILLIYSGPDTCKIVYPSGTLAGVKHTDFGLGMTPGSTGADGTELPMWKDWFSVNAGLSIPDPQSVVRCANIIAGDVLDPGGTNDQGLADYTTNIVFRMSEMIDRVPQRIKSSGATPFWLMPRSVKSGFNIQILARAFGNVYSPMQQTAIGNSPESMYGIPIVISDLMGYAEGAVN